MCVGTDLQIDHAWRTPAGAESISAQERSGAVCAESIPTAVEVARHLRAGQVAANVGRFNERAPLAGHRKFAVARELGEHGLAEYVDSASMQSPAADYVSAFEPAP